MRKKIVLSTSVKNDALGENEAVGDKDTKGEKAAREKDAESWKEAGREKDTKCEKNTDEEKKTVGDKDPIGENDKIGTTAKDVVDVEVRQDEANLETASILKTETIIDLNDFPTVTVQGSENAENEDLANNL